MPGAFEKLSHLRGTGALQSMTRLSIWKCLPLIINELRKISYEKGSHNAMGDGGSRIQNCWFYCSFVLGVNCSWSVASVACVEYPEGTFMPGEVHECLNKWVPRSATLNC